MATNDREFADHRGDRDVRSIGPFDHFEVVVDGFTVPFLQAEYRSDTEGAVTLCLDRRLAIDVPADLAGQVIEFVADAIAIGMGYSCHPRSDTDLATFRKMPPWHRMQGLGDAT